MTATFSFIAQDSRFCIHADGNPLATPGGKPVHLPTKALAEAIVEEWLGEAKFSAAKMPLTSLAYTAIDRMVGKEALTVESLLVYADTDALCYRADHSEKLAQLQRQQWDPVLEWARGIYGVAWQTTVGIMPLEQPQALHLAIEKRMVKLDTMQLTGACVLASGFSSLALALAVLDKYLDAAEAFRYSRLEEETQAARWGRDQEAARSAQRLEREIMVAARFLGLLDQP